MITSTSNAQIRQVATLTKKAKYRKETGLFVMEGGKMFSEPPKKRIHVAYTTERFLADSAHRETMKGVRKVETVSEDVLEAMSDTQMPQGILMLAKQYEHRMKDILKSPGPARIMILETVQDPRNLGAILRTGEGVGVTGAIMSNGTADIYNPEVIHSTMGPTYRVSFVYMDDSGATLDLLIKQNIYLYTAHLASKNSYDEEDYHGGTRFLIGNKTSDLGKETIVTADTLIRTPMPSQVRFLNITAASAILMYGTAR